MKDNDMTLTETFKLFDTLPKPIRRMIDSAPVKLDMVKVGEIMTYFGHDHFVAQSMIRDHISECRRELQRI